MSSETLNKLLQETEARGLSKGHKIGLCEGHKIGLNEGRNETLKVLGISQKEYQKKLEEYNKSKVY